MTFPGPRTERRGLSRHRNDAMRPPFSPLHLIFFLGLLLFITLSIQFGLMALTFEKLGLDTHSALLLLGTSLFGSVINLPLMTLQSDEPAPPPPAEEETGMWPPQLPFDGRTRIMVNVGGCLVPVFFSAYLLRHYPLGAPETVVAVLAVAGVSFLMSRPMHGIGVAMPVLVAPLSAALVAVVLGGEYRAPLAYVAGSLGVLIGADLLRLKDIRAMRFPVASIGGAGTFDGIFMTGLVAVLLS